MVLGLKRGMLTLQDLHLAYNAILRDSPGSRVLRAM